MPWQKESPNRIAYFKKYRESHREQECEKVKRYHKRLRIKALSVVANGQPLRCNRCGCSKIEALAINHTNGDGAEERKQLGAYRTGGCAAFFRLIVSGKRRTDDLEVTCELCNWAHHIERKYDLHYSIKLRKQ